MPDSVSLTLTLTLIGRINARLREQLISLGLEGGVHHHQQAGVVAKAAPRALNPKSNPYTLQQVHV